MIIIYYTVPAVFVKPAVTPSVRSMLNVSVGHKQLLPTTCRKISSGLAPSNQEQVASELLCTPADTTMLFAGNMSALFVKPEPVVFVDNVPVLSANTAPTPFVRSKLSASNGDKQPLFATCRSISVGLAIPDKEQVANAPHTPADADVAATDPPISVVAGVRPNVRKASSLAAVDSKQASSPSVTSCIRVRHRQYRCHRNISWILMMLKCVQQVMLLLFLESGFISASETHPHETWRRLAACPSFSKSINDVNDVSVANCAFAGMTVGDGETLKIRGTPGVDHPDLQRGGSEANNENQRHFDVDGSGYLMLANLKLSGAWMGLVDTGCGNCGYCRNTYNVS